MAKKTKTFEEALSRLEEIVTLMEKGELSLDDTVKLYKEGVELASFCGGKLTDAKPAGYNSFRRSWRATFREAV